MSIDVMGDEKEHLMAILARYARYAGLESRSPKPEEEKKKLEEEQKQAYYKKMGFEAWKPGHLLAARPGHFVAGDDVYIGDFYRGSAGEECDHATDVNDFLEKLTNGNI